MIHCDKCKTVNPPEQRYCLTCHRDLLPGTSFLVRILSFILMLGIAAFSVWILWKMYQAEDVPDLGCFVSSPIWWGLLAVVMPIAGLVFLFKRTPIHERYLDRAKRHLTLDQEQALADMNEALRLAPDKARASILKERGKLLDSLGQTKQALRDRIAVAEDAGAHDGGGDVASLLGADKDAFINKMREQDRDLLRSAGAVAIGYCRRCRMPVELNEKSRCPRHPHRGVSNIRLAVPEDMQSVKADILETRRRENRKRIIGWIVFIVAMLLLYFVFKYIIMT